MQEAYQTRPNRELSPVSLNLIRITEQHPANYVPIMSSTLWQTLVSIRISGASREKLV